MKISDNLNKANNKDNAKNIIGKTGKNVLAFTIFLPFTVYFTLEDKYGANLRQKQYGYIIKNKEKYKEKVLKEILDYMVKKDIPKTISRKNNNGEYVSEEYLIYRDERNNYGDVFGDFHLESFISIWSYGKKHNKKAMKYYNACKSSKEIMEYDWFMDEIEEYFRQFEDIEVERGFQKIWGVKYEYILLKVEREMKT